jgi:hypothetical protein
MTDPLVITILIFIFAAISHILIHRLLVQMGVATFKTMLVFGVLFGLLIFLLYFIFPVEKVADIRYSSIIFYILLSMAYIVVTATPSLGDESPSSRIILFIKKSGSLTKKEIIGDFSDKLLVEKRISDLLKSEYIRKQDQRFIITQNGKKLMILINLYWKILRWELVG